MRPSRLFTLAILAAAAGCSSAHPSNSLFGSGSSDAAANSGSSSGAAAGGLGDGSASGAGDDSSTFYVAPCTRGLVCNQVTCEGGATTTVSGTVYDPAGNVPLYNVVVYVPNAAVAAMPSTGATCDQCGGTVSGDPIAITLTDAKGQFVLNDVPVGTDIPLVMQLGKWRRQVKIPAVAACTNNALTDRNLTRLPRNQGEGDIPRIALATGGADPLECLLRKIGLDDTEFATAGGTGRVHLYTGSGYTDTEGDVQVVHNASSQFAPTLNAGASFADATPFWSSADNLKKYDIVLLACEGNLIPGTKSPANDAGAVDPKAALYDFENAGGRVFASHWHRYWFSNGPAPLPSVATWKDRPDPATAPAVAIGTVNTGFPKGVALRDWLLNVGASRTPGELPIKDSKHNVDAVNLAEAQDWISTPNPNACPSPTGSTCTLPAVEYMTFNTPVGQPAASQCGRVVYSDLHVSSGDETGKPFPTGCVTSMLSPQEKALEFMLFDLSSCVMTDTAPPKPPPR